MSLRFSPSDPGGHLVPSFVGSLTGQAWTGLWSSLQRLPSLTLPAPRFAGLLGGGERAPEASSSHFLVPFSPGATGESLTWACKPCFPGRRRTSHYLCRPGAHGLTVLLLPSRLGVPCPCCSLRQPRDCLLPNTRWSQTKESTQLTCLGLSSISSRPRLTRAIITGSLSPAWASRSSSHTTTITNSRRPSPIQLCLGLSSPPLPTSRCRQTHLPSFPEPSRWLRSCQMRTGTCGRSWKDATRRWRGCRRWGLRFGLAESSFNHVLPRDVRLHSLVPAWLALGSSGVLYLKVRYGPNWKKSLLPVFLGGVTFYICVGEKRTYWYSFPRYHSPKENVIVFQKAEKLLHRVKNTGNACVGEGPASLKTFCLDDIFPRNWIWILN